MLKSEIRPKCPLLPFFFNTVLEVLAISIIQERKKDPNWKGRSKLSLCADGKRVNIQKLKDCPYKVLKLINEFSKVAIYYKISIQKLVAFLYTNMKYQKGSEI